MRYLHWGPYVGSTKIDNHIIERLHEDGKKDLESYHKKLAGHVKRQVKYNDETTDWFYKQVSPIFDAYRQGHLEYHGLEKREVHIAYDDLWVNFMRPGDFNPLHTHGGDFSFVIFVDVPEEIEKEIKEFEQNQVLCNLYMALCHAHHGQQQVMQYYLKQVICIFFLHYYNIGFYHINLIVQE